MPLQTRRHALRLVGAAALLPVLPLLAPAPAHAAADAAGLIGALTGQLGITRPQAEGGAGALFGLARQRMAPDQYQQVESSVPGIGDLVARHGSGGARPSGGGALGDLAGGALGNLGGGGGAAGSLGALAPLAGQFSSLGLSPDMAGRFLPVVLQYLNGNGAGNAAGLLGGALGG